MAATPFVYGVVSAIGYALLIICLVIEAFAFLNCLTQKADAFAAIGTLSKGVWLALTFGAVVVTLVFSLISILGIIAISAAAIYLLDVRPALREASEGHGPW
jgi:Protein of unknown function (DUF2516)